MDREELVTELQKGNLKDRYILEGEDGGKSRIFSRVSSGTCVGHFSEKRGIVIDYSQILKNPQAIASALEFRAELARRRIYFTEEPDRAEVKRTLTGIAREYRTRASEYELLAHRLNRD